MLIHRSFVIEVAVPKDDLRPVLNYINVTRWRDQDVAVACDGFMLAMVPVVMEEGDQYGLIPAEALTMSRKLSWSSLSQGLHDTARNYEISISKVTEGVHAGGAARLTLGEAITLSNGWAVPWPDMKDMDKYPDFSKVVDAIDPTKPTAYETVLSFNPHLMVKLYKALGIKRAGVVGITGKGAALVVRARHDDRLVPPFGLLMPIHNTSVPAGIPVPA